MWKKLIFGVALFCAAPVQAAWHEASSKHFDVYADEDPSALKQYADKLERFDAAVRQARGVPDVQPGAATRVTLFVVRDIDAIEYLFDHSGYGDSGVAGFYIQRASGSVAFVPLRGENGEFGLGGQNVFFHEYTHHLMLQSADRPLPTWLVEGFAEFFASPRFNPDGSVVIGAPPTWRAAGLVSTAGLSLEKMVGGEYSELTPAEFESLYARGWLLTHLLSFDLARRGQLTRYLDEIEHGTPARKAAEDAFGDLQTLDRELDHYYKRASFTAAIIPAAELHVPPIAIRALSPGEAALMSVRIRLARTGGEGAGDLFRKARRVAAEHPDDPAVQTILAAAELAAGHDPEAAAAADRVLKMNPRSSEALILKGKAEFALAKAHPQTADWAAVRSLFVQANRIDTQNAEPLLFFYRTYVAAGVKPTANALGGLKYAVALAPRDAHLRMEAVGQFIGDGSFADARTMLIPLVYSPHAGKYHDLLKGILDRIDARDQAGAQQAWKGTEHFLNEG
jgi:tetratricopeptide (TPR) repeat protein